LFIKAALKDYISLLKYKNKFIKAIAKYKFQRNTLYNIKSNKVDNNKRVQARKTRFFFKNRE